MAIFTVVPRSPSAHRCRGSAEPAVRDVSGQGHGGFVLPRSGLAARNGITLVNAPGLIDAGYRGEVQVVMLNTDAQTPFVVEPGMRIAQLVVLPVPAVELVELEELPGTERGARGFGSSRA